jgi:hypothetical protein
VDATVAAFRGHPLADPNGANLMALANHELRDEPSRYNQYGKPALSRRAVRMGLTFCTVFYGSRFAIVGGGAWIVRYIS